MKEKQGTINTEKRGVDEQRLIEHIAELERRLKEVEAENIVLRELAYQSEQRYEQIKQLMKQNDELRRQLQQRPQPEETGDAYKEERPDSWFFHTLRQENAIAPRPERSKEK
ncbi:spore coat protein [Geobacillus genomosp. 3]|uniref:Spore coat protein n=1 Tax=Geobacillus genomosp. 3 TaxID=1921421 RepID=S6A0J4_GEOG3|nr:spore coat protein [Geobacillus genomosp. 3]AGT31176.1 spore coat protein [Geobacillus genomosp. 3]